MCRRPGRPGEHRNARSRFLEAIGRRSYRSRYRSSPDPHAACVFRGVVRLSSAVHWQQSCAHGRRAFRCEGFDAARSARRARGAGRAARRARGPAAAACWSCGARRASARRRCSSTRSNRRRTFTLLRAVGVESEMELPFAALHQLCAPIDDVVDRLPAPQREALEITFGLRAGAAPDRFLVALATLSLFSEAAQERPLLCVDRRRAVVGPRLRAGVGVRRAQAAGRAGRPAVRRSRDDRCVRGSARAAHRGPRRRRRRRRSWRR